MINEVHSTPPTGSPGSAADIGPDDVVSYVLEDDVAMGLFVTQGSEDRTCAAIGAATDLLLGLVTKHTLLATPRQIDEDGVIQSGVQVGLEKSGRRHVLVKGAFGPTLPVYVRYVANVDEAVGSLSSSADPGENRLVPRAAIRWLSSGEDDIAEIEMNLHDDVVDPDET